MDADDPGDCSGTIFAILRECGVGGVSRTTAKVMLSQSSLTYPGKYITFEEIEPGDFVGFTFSKDRPFGHIGLALDKTRYGIVFLMFHQSSSKGAIVAVVDKTNMKDYLMKHVVCFKTRT